MRRPVSQRGLRCSSDAAGPATPPTPGLGHVNLDGSGRGAVAARLALSLNDQDFEAAIPATLSYAYYAQPRVLAVSPQAGPVQGNTHVTLVVDGLPPPEHSLANGSRLECKFGGAAPVAARLTKNVSLAAAFTVGAAAASAVGNASGRVVHCVSPAATEGEQPLYVSLNAQDYRSDGSANFTFYAPPTVSAVFPAGGPQHGGTAVRVVGRGADAQRRAARAGPLQVWAHAGGCYRRRGQRRAGVRGAERAERRRRSASGAARWWVGWKRVCWQRVRRR